MELFNGLTDPDLNILPRDGVVNYHGIIIEGNTANQYFKDLFKEIAWVNDEARLFGRHIITKRKVAWYGDKPFNYTYSNNTKVALLWTKRLLELKLLAEESSGETYNSCLLNLYHNGDEGMAWHSDGEKDLKKDGAIASMSLGAQRTFSFKHKTLNDKISLPLENGSLLVMKENTQSHWLHRLPPTKKVTTPRINLTFRSIEQQS